MDKLILILIISSSHQDIAWMDSPEKCMIYRDEQCITPALALMAANPQYTFVMENMLNLMEYVERHPERKDDILRYTREGRMEWGATFNQPYESLMTGEELVRQVYFGRRWLRENFPGCEARVYFNPDVPGRAMQMQQILAKSGVPYMVISRYHQGLYKWASPDGTSVLTYSPGHYGNSAAILNAKPEEGVKLVTAYLDKWLPYYEERGIAPGFPILHSEDFSQPKDFGGLIKAWGEKMIGAGTASPMPSRIQYSSAAGFFKTIDIEGTKFDRIEGERPGLWLYIHGPTHHWAISAHREAGYLLPAAEIFNTAATLLGGAPPNYPAAEMREAWKAAIFPDHGWGGKEGQVTDRLFRKMYEKARDMGRGMLEAALKRISPWIKTAPEKGLPVVVFNSLSWKRTGPLTVTVRPVGGTDPGVVKDAKGKIEPSQVLPPLPDQAPGTARIEFIARDVPAMGYKTYYLTDGGKASVEVAGGGAKTAADESGPPRTHYLPVLNMNDRATQDRIEAWAKQGDRGLSVIHENAFYRMTLGPGGIESLFDKELGWELLDTAKFKGFEIFTMRSVGNGAGEFGRVQKPTMEGFDKLSNHPHVWTKEQAESGPVRTVYAMWHTLPDCEVRERIIVYEAIKRIDCEVELRGWDGSPYREYRIGLPVGAGAGQVAYDVPMGYLEVGKSEAKGTGGPAYGNLVYDEEMSDIRPREVQNFLSVTEKDGAGMPLFCVTMSTSVAVNDYADPTSGAAGEPMHSPLLQGILLASRRSCHGEGNWYLQEGDHAYRFSITSHKPAWRSDVKSGVGANVPFFAVVGPETVGRGTAGAPTGGTGAPTGLPSYPEEMSFFKVSGDFTLVSTIKKAEDDDSAIVRLYDVGGVPEEVEIASFAPFARAELVNMIEQEGKPIPMAGKNAVRLKVGPYSIETIRLIR
jgi:alpha-mannosidase